MENVFERERAGEWERDFCVHEDSHYNVLLVEERALISHVHIRKCCRAREAREAKSEHERKGEREKWEWSCAEHTRTEKKVCWKNLSLDFFTASSEE